MGNPGMASGFDTSGTYNPDNLINGEFPALIRKGTLLSGENRARGTVLGKITASGKLKMAVAANNDGSEAVHVVLAMDCDASAADKECLYYVTGEFNPDKLTFGAGHTAASARDAARLKGMHW